jgi:hypothetical protein
MKTKRQNINYNTNDNQMECWQEIAKDVLNEIIGYKKLYFDIIKHWKRIQEFRKIYKEEYGTELSEREALEYWTILLNFIRLLIELEKDKM